MKIFETILWVQFIVGSMILSFTDVDFKLSLARFRLLASFFAPYAFFVWVFGPDRWTARIQRRHLERRQAQWKYWSDKAHERIPPPARKVVR